MCDHPNMKQTTRKDYCPDCGYEFYYSDAHAGDTVDPEMDIHTLLEKAVFGLEAQGHISTIQKMLPHSTWEEIGNKIGWCPKTARTHYERWYWRNRADMMCKKDILPTLAEAIGMIEQLAAKIKLDTPLKSEIHSVIHEANKVLASKSK